MGKWKDRFDYGKEKGYSGISNLCKVGAGICTFYGVFVQKLLYIDLAVASAIFSLEFNYKASCLEKKRLDKQKLNKIQTICSKLEKLSEEGLINKNIAESLSEDIIFKN